jgi:hypothetical protein
MAEITLESTVVRSQEVMASPMEQELVMMDVEQGAYYGLDEVGADIWNRLAAPTQVADLCARLQVDYEVDAATCQADVLAVLNEMAAHRLVKLA